MKAVDRSVAVALLVAVSLCGCSRGAPPHSLPSTKSAGNDAFGSWVRFQNASGDWAPEGELLAASADTVWIYDSAGVPGVRGVALAGVRRVRVFKYDSDAGNSGGLAALGALSTISHGVVLLISAPVWIATGLITSNAESESARFNVTAGEWMRLCRYARYPAGRPSGLDWRAVRPRPDPSRPQVPPQENAWPASP